MRSRLVQIFGIVLLIAGLINVSKAVAAGLDQESDLPPANLNDSQFQSNSNNSSATQSVKIFFPVIYGNPKPSGSLADGWYLMVDDGHIASRDVARHYHPYEKYPHNPVMVADKPWEGKAIQLYGTVLPGFRMWYSSYNKAWGGITQVLYAESENGINWYKPNVSGTDRNALFGGEKSNIVSVMHTPRDRSKPIKMMTLQNKVFNGYWSKDGIDTHYYPENPLFHNGNDVAHFYWDPNTGRYGGTAKEKTSVGGVERRTTRFISSDDFINWRTHSERLIPDSVDDQLNPGFYTHFYGLPVFPMGEQYVGNLWILKASDTSGQHGKVNIQLVSSHDGLNWIREEGDRPPILDVGPAGAWDAGQIYTATSPIPVGNELWLYYSGCNLEHGSDLNSTICGIGLAKAPYNRLVSLGGTGTVLTHSIPIQGSHLFINYEAIQGSIRVELISDGSVIAGYEANNCIPMSGDSLKQLVSWTGQSELPSDAYQIKFHLENGAIFAFLID